MPSEPPHVAEVEGFLAERGERLLRTAIVLAGSRDAGEDLLQAALERTFRNWRRIRGDPEGYLRRTLAHLATDGWRRNGRWRSRLGLLRAADAGYRPDDTGRVDLRDQLVRLLAQLPPRQRAAIVLRFWEELSEAETAEVMGCSTGAVKSAGVQRGHPARHADHCLPRHHVTRALAALPAGTIVFDRMTHVPPGTGPGYYPADTWATRTQSRTLTYTQAGQLAADYGDTITRTTYQAVAVNYRDKTWWRIANSNRNPNVAGPVRPVPSQFTCGKNGPQLPTQPAPARWSLGSAPRCPAAS